MSMCYRDGGCGPYEMYSCNECPASKPDYLQRNIKKKPKTIYDLIHAMTAEELALLFSDIAEWMPEYAGKPMRF